MQKVILVIRDGWGYRESCEDNAICQAPTPYTDCLMQKYPTTLLDASGEAVGLPSGYQGNSEVGHTTIGSGRIIRQPMMRINEAISDGSFLENEALLGAIQNCRDNDSDLHVMGLLQSEGVHAHEQHLHAILELCKREDFDRVLIHVFTDGRDAPVQDGLKHVKTLVEKIEQIGIGKIVSISGRYYAMDRDKRWDRTRQAWETIVLAKSEDRFSDIVDAIENSYEKEVYDEFIVPKILNDYQGIETGDSIIFFNFRTDRPRQLTQAIVESEFLGWERKPLDVYFVAMTQYYKPMNAHVAFADISLDNLLGELISKAGYRQLRISETEKYAHVTFFFNGQVEKPFEGEDRIMINSPQVATYDLKPEMSVYEVTDALVEQIASDNYQFIVVNLVNGDLVGHTGVVEACHKAVESVDICLGRIVDKALEKDYSLLVFADHGNIEDQTPKWRTSHTTNPVPLIFVSPDTGPAFSLRSGGGLVDIAPTVLELMGIQQPAEITGTSLLSSDQ